MPVEGGLPVDLADDVFMGHEFSAEVLEAGPDTEAHPPGTLVTSLPVLLSAKGFEPIAVQQHHDRRLRRADAAVGTAAADASPTAWTRVTPSLTEPMAVGLHAVNKSSIQPGEAALVIGCGPIGIAIIAALRRRGVETHCGCRLFAEAARAGDDDGRTPDVGSGAGITVRPRQAGGGVRGGRRSRNHQRRDAARTDGDPAGRRRGVHGTRHRSCRSSASPKRSTCSS